MNSYILTILLILSAPSFIAATIYMTLKHIILSLNAEQYSPISPRCLTSVFVVADIICFCTQMGRCSNANHNIGISARSGTHCCSHRIDQSIHNILFLRADGLENSQEKQREAPTAFTHNPYLLDWKKYIYALCISSACILIRNLVRIAECVEGQGGSMQKTDAYIYVFDASLMLISMVVLAVFHPGKLTKTATALRYTYRDIPDDY
ncbi:hypothetical protein ACMFMG_001960 [Clarireedia jacksonii]